MKSVITYLSFLALSTSAFAFSQVQNGAVSDKCIGCICYASSGCRKNAGCTEAGVCGPLLISWAYWADAGKLVINDGTDPSSPNAYPQCAQDAYCAAETLRTYMAKYGKDCNEDGRIDCDDYARIHKRGASACTDPTVLDTKYYKEFSTCSAQLQP